MTSQKSLIAEWLGRASQRHEIHCRDLEVMGLNIDLSNLGCVVLLSHTWAKTETKILTHLGASCGRQAKFHRPTNMLLLLLYLTSQSIFSGCLCFQKRRIYKYKYIQRITMCPHGYHHSGSMATPANIFWATYDIDATLTELYHAP